mmetsp:Transcript_27437/g.59931  ORF Transcript_27437/g.59931 Transcript_27437/m.59931 type:complete len:202 (-) Transcript_27437:1524-2129(-)
MFIEAFHAGLARHETEALHSRSAPRSRGQEHYGAHYSGGSRFRLDECGQGAQIFLAWREGRRRKDKSCRFVSRQVCQQRTRNTGGVHRPRTLPQRLPCSGCDGRQAGAGGGHGHASERHRARPGGGEGRVPGPRRLQRNRAGRARLPGQHRTLRHLRLAGGDEAGGTFGHSPPGPGRGGGHLEGGAVHEGPTVRQVHAHRL